MQDKLISLYIRPHLIPFMYQELQGDTKAVYVNKKVKLIRVKKQSPLGQMLRVFKSRAATLKACNAIIGYNLFISLDENSLDASMVKLTEGHPEKNKAQQNKELQLLSEDVKCINDILESMFKISLIQFIKGYLKETLNSKKNIRHAIHLFMLEYNLYDTLIDPENLRAIYYYNTSETKDYLLDSFKTPVSSKRANYS